MKCPFCKSHDLRVIDTRPADNDTAISRRRECQGCKNRWRTVERVEFAERGRLPKGRPAKGTPGIELVAMLRPEPVEGEQRTGRNGYQRRKEIPPLPGSAPGPVVTNPVMTIRAEKKRKLEDFMARYRDAQRAAKGE